MESQIAPQTTHDVIDLKRLRLDRYPDIAITRFLNVEYVHMKTDDGGDLYVTKHGLPFVRLIVPENWYTSKWFRANRERLKGTSTIYKVATKKIKGRSIDLVVKWCRVGQEVPLETKIIENVLNAEFNSPFEEFSLVEELRSSSCGPPAINVMLQRPLGIYVPPERLQLWQTGRSKQKIMSKLAKHPGVEIDILRQYILIYKWVRGLDAVQAFEQSGLSEDELRAFTGKVINDLRQKGFRVLDQKPAHFIVRLRPSGAVMKNRKNDLPYALVDFELLERTPEHDKEVKAIRRSAYLKKQRDRFVKDSSKKWPQHLHSMTIMGVDYVCGPTESTSGILWVVGDDPDLFDYFQPERWRKTPRTRLSPTNDIYYTKTKDDINIVWKISRVGERPDVPPDDQGKRITDYGYNSPFEEFSMALQLGGLGLATTYPRAIYMTGHRLDVTDNIADESRFFRHAHILLPDSQPVLRRDHDYITVWGFWNGPDESLAERDAEYYTGVNLVNAYRRNLINEQEYDKLLEQVRQMLLDRGMEHLALKGNHVMISLNSKNELIRRPDGRLEVRLCNFESMRRVLFPSAIQGS